MKPGTALCLVCGRSGPIVGQSLHPGHPLVRCYWEEPRGVGHGHGVRVGTLDQAESDAIQIAKRERRLTLSHQRGNHDGDRCRYCPLCEAKRPHKRLAVSGG